MRVSSPPIRLIANANPSNSAPPSASTWLTSTWPSRPDHDVRREARAGEQRGDILTPSVCPSMTQRFAAGGFPQVHGLVGGGSAEGSARLLARR